MPEKRRGRNAVGLEEGGWHLDEGVRRKETPHGREY
jgi:hypothetical protein